MRPAAEIEHAPGINPAFINIQNSLNPAPGFQQIFFPRIDMDVFEPSSWEYLVPPNENLSHGIQTGR
jgi:hypothetical protein